MKKLLLVLVALSFTSLFVGVSELEFMSVMAGDPSSLHLLFTSRLPRLIAILLAGSALSIAGLIMQQISQNRFAAPSTSGTIECAVLGYVLSLVFLGHGQGLWLIFGCSILGTLIFVQFIQRIQFKNAVFIPLIGIIFGNVIQSGSTFLAYKYDVLQNMSTWAVANFATLLAGDFELLYIAVPIGFFTYFYATRISAVGIGKDFATNLGLNYQQVITIGVILVSVLSATVVMIVGELPFLGLIVPNLVSHFFGDNLKKNIPLTIICGALLVLGCDILSRLIIFPYEIPISMVLSILGGCVFLFLITRSQVSER
ncbi:iron chelate uptake ABC transporter permease subunit VctD [Veronia pacifica]|uniref:Iron ABC transporter n=1 Tax=Veronia pacifica TaxID=1080227 RepID=A0A1C3EBY8_9GAMM|nr:iron chelate uptake ABC transporter permease subunit VctD [Veronia pacifica]ODA30710.1 iron ABC transporter [Veronia pacifica]